MFATDSTSVSFVGNDPAPSKKELGKRLGPDALFCRYCVQNDSPALMEAAALKYWDTPLQVNAHAVGDQAVEIFIVAFEKARKIKGRPAVVGPVLQHGALIRPDQVCAGLHGLVQCVLALLCLTAVALQRASSLHTSLRTLLCCLSPPCCHFPTQIKRLKAISATASFTMASTYTMAKDYFSIYKPEYIK
jgi:hypothetical protein